MNNITVYIVFHKYLFPRNIPPYPCFKYLAVNENIIKEIDHTQIKHDILYEYDMPRYNSIYQMIKFNENSAILNLSPPSTNFTGFCQYDMIIDKDEFDKILKSLHIPNLMIGFFYYDQKTICDILSSDGWNQIINIYNKKYEKNHTMISLKECPFFLMNTYILPTWFFIRLQSDIKLCLPTILKLLNYNMRHIGGTLERFNSLIIACAIKEGLLRCALSNAITDNRSQTINKEDF